MPKTKKKMNICCEQTIKKAKRKKGDEAFCSCGNSFLKDNEGEWKLVYSGNRTNGRTHERKSEKR